MLDARSRRSAREVKKDHWLAQTGFGLFVGALIVWLVILYRGAPFGF
jgi:hypothetical protein